MPDLKELVALSRRFGADPEWVLAGGGNTSLKDEHRLLVKASGTSLGTIDESGFCAIERSRLDRLWSASYPESSAEREAAVLADLLASRSPGETKRPSVETLLHGLLPQTYVVHTHPAVVNGVTCAVRGREIIERLFGEEGIWLPFVDPGYLLAKAVRAGLEAFRARTGSNPACLFMQNHGLLVAGESPEEVERISQRVVARIGAEIRRRPDLSARPIDVEAAASVARALSRLSGGATVRALCDEETLARSASPAAFAPLASAFTPDHIVYAGHAFLFVEAPAGTAAAADALSAAVEAAWGEFRARQGQAPRIVAVQGLGVFACASGEAAARNALLLYTDACKIAVYAESFGGVHHMTKAQIDFIRGWEAESYRASVSR